MDITSLFRPGYGLFWVANSISSTVLGSVGRGKQLDAADENEAYQRALEEARNQFTDEMEEEKMAFRRKIMEQARQYRISESQKLHQQQLEGVEMQSFIERYWPLAPQLPDTLQKEYSSTQVPTTLNVILMHCPLLPGTEAFGSVGVNKLDGALYKDIEHSIKYSDEPLIGDIKFRRDACIRSEAFGGNAIILNIHFLMGHIPTLVLVPYYEKEKIHFKGAVWDSNSSQPLVREMCSIDFNPKLAASDDLYRKAVLKNFRFASSILMGVVRDSYALITLGKAPTLQTLLEDGEHAEMLRFFNEEQEIKKFAAREYESLQKALSSYDSPKLLNSFSKEELRIMDGLVKKQISKLN